MILLGQIHYPMGDIFVYGIHTLDILNFQENMIAILIVYTY